MDQLERSTQLDRGLLSGREVRSGGEVGSDTTTLDVSILIATRNRARLLQQTLEYLAAQQSAQLSWEVIVVDNGSSDRTPEVLRGMRRQLPLVVITEPTAGKNRALNRAVAVARGRLLLFTDDDVIVDERWMLGMQQAARRWPVNTILAGSIVPVFEAGVPAWIRDPAFAYSRLVFCGFIPRDTEGPIEQRAFGPNFGLHRDALGATTLCESVGPTGGRATPMGSETSLFKALENKGCHTVFVPAAQVQHVITTDQVRIRKLLNRAFRAGRSDVLFESRSEQSRASTLWKRTAKPALKCISTCFRPRLEKVERSMDLFRALGRAYQRQCHGHVPLSVSAAASEGNE